MSMRFPFRLYLQKRKGELTSVITSYSIHYTKLYDLHLTPGGASGNRQGREIRSAPSFEVYKNNPQTTKPEKLLTEVHVRNNFV